MEQREMRDVVGAIVLGKFMATHYRIVAMQCRREMDPSKPILSTLKGWRANLCDHYVRKAEKRVQGLIAMIPSVQAGQTPIMANTTFNIMTLCEHLNVGVSEEQNIAMFQHDGTNIYVISALGTPLIIGISKDEDGVSDRQGLH